MEAERKEALGAASGSAQVACWKCGNWDRELPGCPPLHGYCWVFQKHTELEHGAYCTAWVSKYASADDGVPPNSVLSHRHGGLTNSATGDNGSDLTS